MIYDHKRNIATYAGIDPRIAKGLALLETEDFASMELGRYEVDGDKLFYLVQAYDSKVYEGVGEAHKRYVDIQYLISGREKIMIGQMEEDSELVSERGDVYFYKMGEEYITLTEGQFAVLWPQDLHGPGMMVESPEACRKVVIKVLLAED